MVAESISFIRRSANWFLASTAPSQLAIGFTLGMLIGFVPKTNLIALSLCILLFSLRCNKGLGLASAILFSLAAPWTDPFAHKLGLMALQVDTLQSTYAAVFRLPFGPWWGFHNTVVAGGLLLGIYAAIPVYFLSRIFFSGVQSVFGQKPGARLGLDPERQPGATV